MSGSLSNAISGLLAAQQAIATTSHNIANANTEGYTRQRVIHSAREAQLTGIGYIGHGVEISGIDRVYSSFTESQLRVSNSESQRLQNFHDLATRLDTMLDDTHSGLNTAQSDFFNALRSAVSNPRSAATRQGVIESGKNLSSRFNQLDAQLNNVTDEINQRVEASVAEINRTAADLAQLNQRIAVASAGGRQRQPNDLLDQRDLLLNRLAEHVSIDTVQRGTHEMTVMIGNGVALVSNNQSFELDTEDSELPTAGKTIAIKGATGLQTLSDNLSGGILGGLADFQRELMDPTRRELGRLATVVQLTFNQQHAAGNDATGNSAGTFFNTVEIPVSASGNNSGSADVSVTISDALQLVGSDYEVYHDGTQLLVTRLADGATVDNGSGDNLSIDGLSIEVTGDMQPGDRFTVQPFARASADIRVNLADSSQLGLSAAASADEGTPGNGDSRNGELLVNLQSQALYNRGENTLAQQLANLVTEVGGVTRLSGMQRDSAAHLHATATSDHDNTSGVNLDEEAVNLVRHQQAYEASARVINVANQMFDTLLATVNR